MVDDPNRKTPRQFQCRDYLWDSFEQLSGELECSIDYLINEAMRHYLRAQGRTGPSAGRASTMNGGNGASMPSMAAPPRMPPPANAAARAPAMPSIPARAPAAPSVPAMARGSGPPAMPAARAPAMPSLPGRTTTAPPAMPSAPRVTNGAPAPPPRAAVPPIARPSAPSQQQRALYAVYDGQQLPVDKEEFIIGRGQKMCDLVIRDTNISRQHARVVLHNGQYWIIDNQSTNGIEFRGAKIQQKRVDDGDVFTICGHDVQFVYQ